MLVYCDLCIGQKGSKLNSSPVYCSRLYGNLTLIGMRGDTFISLSCLDQILSADFLSKLSKLFEGEN